MILLPSAMGFTPSSSTSIPSNVKTMSENEGRLSAVIWKHKEKDPHDDDDDE